MHFGSAMQCWSESRVLFERLQNMHPPFFLLLLFLFKAEMRGTTNVLGAGATSFNDICTTLRWQITKTLWSVRLPRLKCGRRDSISFPGAPFSSSAFTMAAAAAAIVYSEMKFPEVASNRSNLSCIQQPGKFCLLQGILLSSVSVGRGDLWTDHCSPSQLPFGQFQTYRERRCKVCCYYSFKDLHSAFLLSRGSWTAPSSKLEPSVKIQPCIWKMLRK